MIRNGWDEVFTLSSHRNNANGPVQGQYLLGYVASISDPWLTASTHAMMTSMMQKRLEEGFILDRQWFWLRGEEACQGKACHPASRASVLTLSHLREYLLGQQVQFVEHQALRHARPLHAHDQVIDTGGPVQR